MSRPGPLKNEDGDDRDDARHTKAILGIAVMALLILVSVVLAKHLQKEARIEDCLLAGHHDCDSLVTGSSALP